MKASSFALAVLLALGTTAALLAQAPEYQNAPRQLLHIDVRALSPQTLQAFLELNLDVAEFDAASGIFEIIATPNDRNELARLGVSFITQNDNLETYAQTLRAQGYLDHFYDYTETLAEMQLAEALYPTLAQLVDIGDAWRKTQNLAGRDIWAIKISDNVQTEEAEPEVLIIGNHHAREIITPGIVLDYMNYLLANYGSDPYVTHLVNNRQIWLIPVLNPDGLDYVHQTDLWWRKNRRDNRDGSFGVDLNRNYAFKWAYDNVGSSPNTRSETYRGTAPFSEPETAALRDFVNAHQFRVSLSYHSYGNLLIYPWGYVAQHTPDHAGFVALADSIVAYNRYQAGLGIETVGYFVNGDSDDWLYGEQISKNKIFAMTPEVGRAFHPDTSEIEQLISENRGPNLFITYAAGEEPIVVHQPLRDTLDAIGPYRLVAEILPPIVLTTPASSMNQVHVHYKTPSMPSFQAVMMTPTNNLQEFAGEIPGVGANQLVQYYISAEDDLNRVGHAPLAGDAGDYYSFQTAAENLAPVIANTTRWRNTNDFIGPYRVDAEISDDGDSLDAVLIYSNDNGATYFARSMTRSGSNNFSASIPGQSAETRVRYFIEAMDEHGKVTRDPNNAPADFYDFIVTARVADISVQPSQFTFTLAPDTVATDSLLVFNLGLLDLRFVIAFPTEMRAKLLPRDASNAVASSWLQVGIDSALVEGESHVAVPLIVNTTGLRAGTYVDTISIRSNDPDEPLTIVPVQLIIQSTAVNERNITPLPSTFALNQNLPNPFTAATMIPYELPAGFQGEIKLAVYNLLGQQIRVLVQREQRGGYYNVQWDGTDDLGRAMPAGIYFYRLEGKDFARVRKTVLAR